MISVHITGLDQLSKAGEQSIQWKEKFRVKIGAEMRFFGEAVVGTSRQKYLSGRPGLNVVTGRLRSSINYLVKENSTGFGIDVGTNVIYAATHEFGDALRHIPARPFLAPAVADEYDGFVVNLEKVLRQFGETPLGQ